MIRVEMGDENAGYILRPDTICRELVDKQVFFMQCDRGDPAMETIREFFRLIEESTRVSRVKQHRTEVWVLKQGEHGRETNIAPVPAVNGNVFGCGAVPCVQDGDFHFVPCHCENGLQSRT